jgi:hypothetical protein
MSGAPTSSARRAAREVELSLVVTSADPEAVIRRLARLRELGRYVLRPRGVERIVDRYFDTPDGTLRERGLALRLRTARGATTIGLKGPPRSASTHTEDRSERERPFSPAAVDEIGRRIGLARGREGRADGGGGDPDALLESVLGVSVIQRRETARGLRDVLDGADAAGVVLAQLALDRVRFKLTGAEVRHYEVEVEAKRPGRGTKAARDVAAELLARYPGELSEWPYGKLPTGKTIEQLLAEGGLEGLGPDGALMPQAYAQVRERLQARGGSEPEPV